MKQWWKGTLPAWLVTGLLAVNCYFIKRYIERADTNFERLFQGHHDHEKRIYAIETQRGLAKREGK